MSRREGVFDDDTVLESLDVSGRVWSWTPQSRRGCGLVGDIGRRRFRTEEKTVVSETGPTDWGVGGQDERRLSKRVDVRLFRKMLLS